MVALDEARLGVLFYRELDGEVAWTSLHVPVSPA
jgi:hypothetical protein